MHLHKKIPIGAGLGGGSADAAYTLLSLNELFNLQLSQAALLSHALSLGSDCPFFIKNKPCYATGRGEIMHEIEINLSGYYLIIVNPKIHINTGWAFSHINAKANDKHLVDIVSNSPETWTGQLENDFEPTVLTAYPEIEKIIEKLYNNGAVYASLSGSGSSCYGIFSHIADAELFQFPDHYFIHTTTL